MRRCHLKPSLAHRLPQRIHTNLCPAVSQTGLVRSGRGAARHALAALMSRHGQPHQTLLAPRQDGLRSPSAHSHHPPPGRSFVEPANDASCGNAPPRSPQLKGGRTCAPCADPPACGECRPGKCSPLLFGRVGSQTVCRVLGPDPTGVEAAGGLVPERGPTSSDVLGTPQSDTAKMRSERRTGVLWQPKQHL